MAGAIELILDSGAREPAGSDPPPPGVDRGTLRLMLRAQLQALRDRPDVVAVAARHEGGGWVRVNRMRVPKTVLEGDDDAASENRRRG